MSEHKGPWMRPNGNLVRYVLWGAGRMVFREYEPLNITANNDWTNLPPDAVPLVPQPASLPEEGSAEALRFAADVAEATDGVSRELRVVVAGLRSLADQLDRAEAAKVQRDKFIDVVARVLVESDHRFDSACYEWHELDDSTKVRSRQAAADLLDRFDISPRGGTQ